MNQDKKVVKINDIIDSQIPDFILSENPNFAEFLKQYYISQEFQGSSIDLAENLVSYKNIDAFDNVGLVTSTTLTEEISYFDDVINVNSTNGWPSEYGLLKIDNEIITYTGINQNLISGTCNISVGSTIAYISGINSSLYVDRPFVIDSVNNIPTVVSIASTFIVLSTAPIPNTSIAGYNSTGNYNFTLDKPQFTGCLRGFSGVETLSDKDNPGVLKFTSSESDVHLSGSTVNNLSNLFLLEFFKKIKYQFTPGFEEFNFDPRINAPNFISKAKDFYKSKGTEEAFKILFKVLYGEKVEVIKPKDFLSTPSDSKWIVVERFIAELIEGNPLNLGGQTLYQNKNDDGTILDANGSIYRVSSFTKENNIFYNIDIFSGYSNNLNPKGSIFGKFNITPRTYLISDISSGSDTIRVVSTLGFNNSGKLNIDGIEITYTDKTNTEFIGCSGISQNFSTGSSVRGTNYVYSYTEDGELVKFRLLNTLSDIDLNETKLASETDLLKIKNIGVTTSNIFTKSLIYNVPVSIYGGKVYDGLPSDKYGIDKSNGIVRTKYPNQLKNGDFVEVFSITTNQKLYTASVSNVNNETDYIFSIDNFNSLPLNHILKFRRVAKTSSSSNYSNINQKYLIDIQSSYEDNDNYYLTSNGFPSGTISPLKRQYTFNVNISNSGISSSLLAIHNLYDGDIVVVNNYSLTINQTDVKLNNVVGISTGLYLFVKKIDTNEIRLCYTKNDLIQERYVNFADYDSNNTIVASINSLDVSHVSIYNKDLYPLKLFKKIPKTPKYSIKKEETPSGSIAVLSNGLEIQNSKSSDRIYYGPITSISVLSPGKNYNLLNPPKFIVDLGNDTQTKLYPSLKGKIDKIVVTNPGYDYIETPTVEIKGGNNNKVKTFVKLKKQPKEITFNAGDSNVVNTLEPNQFIFNYSHRLLPGDGVVYRTLGNEPIGIGTEVQDGFLENNSVYYVSNVGTGTSFRLFFTYEDSISGINTINLRTRGKGLQKFVTTKEVNVLDEVNIIDSGDFFEYKVLPFTVDNVNKYDDIIEIKNHGFKDSEEVSYSYTGVSLSGLSTTSYYYIKKIDEDKIKLYSNQNLTGSPVNIDFSESQNSSIYTISYSPIRVNIYGKLATLGISTIGVSAEITPIVKGEFTDVRISNSLNYGNTYFNVEDSPRIDLIKGKNCALKPIISNGKIVDVVVISSGTGYFNSVEIKITGKGVGAELHPIITNGQITSVKVIKNGIGYDNYTTLEVKEVGSEAYFKSNLKYWTVNEFSKYSSSILNDGVLIGSNFSKKCQIGIYNLTQNLSSSLGITSTSHSPIIGWSYDGCPIYGPYSYSNKDGSGNIIKMTSSYRNIRRSPINSVSVNIDCIEDYTYEEGYGTLDEYNGRYCVTPEFPNGVYAYFSTETYPFFIGPKFFYSSVKENFETDYNQNININELNLIKHTYPYYIEDLQNYYEYFDFYPSVEKEDFIVSKIESGSIDGLDIIYPGSGYQIGDEIKFNNSGTFGSGALGVVSELEGVGISSINSTNISYDNISFVNDGNLIVGIATTSLNLKDGYYLRISGLSTNYANINGFKKISFSSFNTRLTESLPASTGIVTSIKVLDSITNFDVDSIIKVDTEIMNVIGFDYLNNRIHVKRTNILDSHEIQSEVQLLNNKFSFNNDYKKILPDKNESYYFDSDLISVGVGTTPGSGNTITRYPLGSGSSETKFVRTAGIWMPNHKFISGEEVSYELGENSTEITTNIGAFQNISKLYIVDLGNNIIGFTTLKSDINNIERLVYFVDEGSGKTHKLKTKRNQEIGSILFNETTAYTKSSHGLSLNDTIALDVIVGSTTSFVVEYSNSTSRVSINSQTNPKLKVYRNQKVEFNLSSSTLSNTSFKFYLDENLENEYVGSGTSSTEIYKTSDKVYLNINSNTPSKLYYNLVSNSKEINIDYNVIGNNQIEILPSEFNVTSKIVGLSSSYFVINLQKLPESNFYASIGNTSLTYSVKDSNVSGPIKSTRMKFKGNNYKSLPSISSIGNSGINAKLYPYSNNIGKVSKITPIVNGIYPSDKTLKPSSNLYSVLYLKDNYKVDEIKIINGGRNYLSPPKVKIYNQNTDKIYSSFSAFSELKNSSINNIVISNSGNGIPEKGNKIVFVENTNGIKILEATKQQNSPGVFTISLRVETPPSGFSTSTPIPFEIGDKIFVEGIVSSGKGYNSEFYSFEYFNVVGIVSSYSSPNQTIIRYNINGDPGTPSSYDFAYVINSKDMPLANVTLTSNEFSPNETVNESTVVNNTSGIPNKETVKVYDLNDISIGDKIKGNKSYSEGTVIKIENYKSDFKVSESVSKELGSIEDKGYLSSSMQKIQDNDYYQNFSYSLKSSKQISDWNSPVSDLSHISGFKKFSDLTIESVGVSSITSDVVSNINISLNSYVNVNTINDIDLVLEDVDDNENLYSEILNFNTLKLSDYLLSKENRVLSIDDISSNFDTDATFSILTIDVLPTFGSGSFISKYFTFIESTTSLYTDFELPLLAEIYISKNGSNVNLISYSYFEDISLGSFYTQINPLNSNEILLQFVPYNINNIISANCISDIVPLNVGVTTNNYGNVSNLGINTSFSGESVPTEKIIDLISLSSCNSGNLYVGIGTSNGYISEFIEMSFVWNGQNLLTNIYSDTEIKNLGTVGLTTNSGNISVSFTAIPNTNTYLYINSHLLVDTTYNPSEINLSYGRLNSSRVQFTPANLNSVSISTITSDYSASKYVLEVKKTISGNTQTNLIQINSVHYKVVDDQEKYLNNIDYSVIGNFNDLDFETIYDSGSESYTLVYYPKDVGANYDIKFYEKNIIRAANPLLV